MVVKSKCPLHRQEKTPKKIQIPHNFKYKFNQAYRIKYKT